LINAAITTPALRLFDLPKLIQLFFLPLNCHGGFAGVIWFVARDCRQLVRTPLRYMMVPSILNDGSILEQPQEKTNNT